VSARYCYSVWLRHLRVMHSFCGHVPRYRAAELGPGDSLGIGLAAMLSGVEALEALDVVRYASSQLNRTILRELLELFRARAPIPDETEFPDLQPRLKSYAFPHDLLTDELLARSLSDQRVAAIEAALNGVCSPVSIEYHVPWSERSIQKSSQLDIVYSQAVLEHIEDIDFTHRTLAKNMRDGGVALHAIDFRSHCITPGWDGHLQYSSAIWWLVKGRRPYLLNRRSPSEHLRAMEKAGFKILAQTRVCAEPTISVTQCARPFRTWSEEDRRTTSMTVVAVRVGGNHE
jgi:hypothetical protein